MSSAVAAALKGSRIYSGDEKARQACDCGA